ncbi:MupA/Atu3671 family FMN-dependent luciferase-like monooxygenase [Flavobacteriaceae bacterium M23B6Z8]
MEFSIMFFGSSTTEKIEYNTLFEIARKADKNDLDAIWTPERHFGDFGAAFPSPSVLGAAIAMATEKINIRSGSVVLPLQDPIRVAEEWALVDNLSNGRIGISIASGWRADDFVFYGSEYENRHQKMQNLIVELKKLWNREPVIRKNGDGKDFEVLIRPVPVTKELPLWVTAAGRPETFEYAGKVGANLLTHMLKQSMDDLKESITIYRNALIDNGFDVSDKKISLMLHTYLDSSEEEARRIAEVPFKEYLKSSIKMVKPKESQSFDVNNLVEMAYRKYNSNNTLIGSPESCQNLLKEIESIGVTEVVSFIDFGIENGKVIKGIDRIFEAKNLFSLSKMYLEA